MVQNSRRLAAIAVALGLGVGAMAPARADDGGAGGLGDPGGLLSGLLTGDGGLLGPRGLLGGEGGLLPGLLGGHDTPGEFAEGSADLAKGMVDLLGAMGGLVTAIPESEPVGGERVGEDNRVAGGLLDGLLGGLLGRS